VFDDTTMTAIGSALSGLAARQRVIADNIANINTPGYQARRVEFEDALRSALADGGDAAVTPQVARSLEPTRLDGNNVNLDDETLDNVDTGLRYSLMRASMRTS
jgi:flagellar basal-body rod protein FlgB